MNFTIEFLSSSSSFFLDDMERYPFEISTYVSGALVFIEPASFLFSDSNSTRIWSTSNDSSNVLYPYDSKVLRILSSFSAKSRTSRAIESDCLSIPFTSLLKDLSESRSEEHTSELQSHVNLVCRLLLEKKKKKKKTNINK